MSPKNNEKKTEKTGKTVVKAVDAENDTTSEDNATPASSSGSEADSNEGSSSEGEEEKSSSASSSEEKKNTKIANNEESDSSTSESSSEVEAPKKKSTEAEVKKPKKEKSVEAEKPTENEKNGQKSSAGLTVFMKNFAGKLSEEEIRKEMETLGEIVQLVIPQKRDSTMSRGFLLCHFKNRESVDEALKLNGKKFLECDIYVEEIKEGLKEKKDFTKERAQTRVENREKKGDSTDKFVLFVGNLPYEMDEYKFKKYIEEQGDVKGIRIPQDQETGRKRGFAFFEFHNKEEMLEFKRKNLVWDDRKLNLNESDGGKRDSSSRGSDDRRGGDRRNGDRRGNDRRGNDDRRGEVRRSNGGRYFDDKKERGGDRRNENFDKKRGSSEGRKENSKKIKFDDSSE